MNREELEKVHQQALKYYEEYVSKRQLKKEDEEKIATAKKDWETSWNKLMQTLLVLERLEI